MAGAPAPYTPSQFGVYGNNNIGAPVQAPNGLFNGLGPAQLSDPANLQMQTFNPTAIDSSLIKTVTDPTTYKGPGGAYTTDMNAIKNTQNSNLAGYDATQAANTQNIGYLQQGAIAQNRLLGELNSRGLLPSFEQGGAGTADFQQLQNNLNNAVGTSGASLQNELSGLTSNDAAYQMAMANYNNELNNFGQYQQNNNPGLTDIMGLGGSALGMITGLKGG